MASEMNLQPTIPQELTLKFPWRFILIAFGISWTCWFFAALTGQNIFTNLEVGIVAVLGAFGPAIAGIIMIYFVFIFGPFSEELGWRDYALDWLQARYSALVSSVILGVIWWAWHLPLLAVAGSFLYQNGQDPVFLAGYLYVVVIYSVLFTWVYNNSARSVLAIILLHFSINLTSRVLVMPAEIFTYNSFILLAVLALVLWRYGGRHLVRGDHNDREKSEVRV